LGQDFLHNCSSLVIILSPLMAYRTHSLTLLKKSQGKLLGPDFGDIKWSTASIRSRVGQLNALAFLDDLWAKTFSTTSLVRAVSRLDSSRHLKIFENPRGKHRDESRCGTQECVRHVINVEE